MSPRRPGALPTARRGARRGRRATTRAAVAVLSLVAAVACAAAGAALTACDDGDTSYTYRDDHYGFSITLDDRFQEWQRADAGDQGAFAVRFADKDGPTQDDRYLDTVTVAVVDMGTDLGDAQTESMRALLRQQSSRALATLGADVRTWPSEDVTVNGLTGSVIPFTATVGDADVSGRNYLFVRGRFLYLVTITSTQDAWGDAGATLQRMAESFTLDE